MRPERYCEKFLPWFGTNKGELEDVCIDREKRTVKSCNACIDRENNSDTETAFGVKK